MKNYIGLSFDLSGQYTDSFNKILKGIELEKYTWYVKDSEIIFSDAQGHGEYLPNGVYSGEDFINLIKNPNYYVILVCLYGVPNSKDFNIDCVSNYEDYLGSNADIAMFVADGTVDLYSKDGKILGMIHQNCLGNEGGFIDLKGKGIKLFTLEENLRTGFYV